ncbi:MAG: CBS domain-containing protein [Chloroflexi bacterium]|nr:CBS domain-containing protein [Chloroflexota bacterium]
MTTEESTTEGGIDLSQRAVSPLARLLVRLAPPPYLVLSIVAVLIGVGTGYGAVLFIQSLHWVEKIAEALREDYGILGMFLSLGIGGALGAPLIVYVASEARGHGVPEVMMAIAVHGGRIRPRVVVVKAIASALTIGSGGSAGREGPIVQIGSALGSTLGQLLDFSEERIKILVASGAAGGIAATFNAPIAGVIFALEVILGEFSMGYFGVVVISAVSASIISRAYLGAAPAFHVPAYGLNSVWEIPLYIIVGVASALLAVFFIVILYKAEDLFEEWKAPEVIKPVVGMLLTGVVAVIYPQVLGPGLHFIGEAIAVNMQMSLTLLAPLAIAKLVATSFTLGAGNSGGVFAPSLFSGAALGGSLGIIFRQWFPGLYINPGAYALVGMAATFAGAARAPITAILIVFEMSNDYRLILPLMLATVISTAIAHYIHPESIYTLKLARRGIVIRHGRDIDVMESVTVEQAMQKNPVTVPETMPLSELGEMFVQAHGHGFPVVNEKGELVGIVSLADYQQAMKRKDFDRLRVRDIMTRDLLVAYPDETLWEALRKLGLRDVSRLPVVSRQNPKQLLGVIRRRDIIRAYNLAMARRGEIAQRLQELRVGEADTEYIHLELPADAWAVGKQVKELHLPEDCVLVSIRRGRRVIVPHGDTVLQPGDRITIFSTRECKPRVLNILKEGE